jgi:hypothetical protein
VHLAQGTPVGHRLKSCLLEGLTAGPPTSMAREKIPERAASACRMKAVATSCRKFRGDPAWPAARAAGSSHLAEIRPGVAFTRSVTAP